jgi:DNA-binding CsgD family transcriptional regulator
VPDDCPLTGSEFEVVCLLAEGLSAKQVAARRHCSVSTIRTLAHIAYARLGVRDRVTACLLFRDRGWIAPLEVRFVPEEPARPLTSVQRMYVDAFMRWTREGPVEDVLPVLLRMVQHQRSRYHPS